MDFHIVMPSPQPSLEASARVGKVHESVSGSHYPQGHPHPVRRHAGNSCRQFRLTDGWATPGLLDATMYEKYLLLYGGWSKRRTRQRFISTIPKDIYWKPGM